MDTADSYKTKTNFQLNHQFNLAFITALVNFVQHFLKCTRPDDLVSHRLLCQCEGDLFPCRVCDFRTKIGLKLNMRRIAEDLIAAQRQGMLQLEFSREMRRQPGEQYGSGK